MRSRPMRATVLVTLVVAGVGGSGAAGAQDSWATSDDGRFWAIGSDRSIVPIEATIDRGAFPPPFDQLSSADRLYAVDMAPGTSSLVVRVLDGAELGARTSSEVPVVALAGVTQGGARFGHDIFLFAPPPRCTGDTAPDDD